MNNAMKTTLVLATLAVASLAPAQVAIFSDRSEARPVAIEPAKTWALNYGWQVSACGLLAPLGSVRIGAARHERRMARPVRWLRHALRGHLDGRPARFASGYRYRLEVLAA